MDRETRRGLISLALLAGVLLGSWALRRHLGLEWSAESIRELVRGYGLWGPLAFVAIVGLRPVLLVPSQILLVAAGLCFGALAGALYGALGILVSGTLAFCLARYAGREVVLASVPPTLHRVFEAGSSRAGVTALFLGTAYPVGPITAFHAGAGLTAMTLPVFWLVLALGGLIRSGVYTVFGSSLVAADGRALLLASLLLAGVCALPFAHPRGRAWLRRTFGFDAPRPPGAAPDSETR